MASFAVGSAKVRSLTAPSCVFCWLSNAFLEKPEPKNEKNKGNFIQKNIFNT